MSVYILSVQIEYTLVTLDKDKKVAKLSLVGPDILPGLQLPESEDPAHHTTKWRPEYASYMIEGEVPHPLCIQGECQCSVNYRYSWSHTLWRLSSTLQLSRSQHEAKVSVTLEVWMSGWGMGVVSWVYVSSGKVWYWWWQVMNWVRSVASPEFTSTWVGNQCLWSCWVARRPATHCKRRQTVKSTRRGKVWVLLRHAPHSMCSQYKY